jgi:hypothetical protein
MQSWPARCQMHQKAMFTYNLPDRPTFVTWNTYLHFSNSFNLAEPIWKDGAERP